MGKTLTALNYIKQLVKDNIDKVREDEECKTIVDLVLRFPSLNDESWRYFVPRLEKEEVMALIEKIKDCLNF
jgi:hypothetical protein